MLTPPLPVVLPLLMAAVLAALHRRIPCWLASLLAILTGSGVACVALSMLNYTRDEPIVVYWLGGGICVVIDNAGAMLVLLASTLTTASLIFSTRYFDRVAPLYQSLMLAFLGAMCGLSQTGDLLNLFVFVELMSAAAFALGACQPEAPRPAYAALRFARTHGIGAALMLAGITLLYQRTGTLNMAQLGRALDGRADALVAAAFVSLVCGLFVHAAIVPFQFWFAGAHVVAAAPVCVLLSGVTVELALYAIVRIYWSVFSGVIAPHEGRVRALLATFGALTAIGGSALCYVQHHLKRLLAYSTVAHMGVLLLGVALLTPQALAGVAICLLGHALLKGGLFLSAGIVLRRTGGQDEAGLAEAGHRLPWVAALLIAGALGLAGMPPFAPFWGRMMIGGAAHGLRNDWIEWVVFAATSISSAALVRFSIRALLGTGTEAATPHRHTPAAMAIPAAGLIALGLLAGLAPRLTGAAEAAAIHIQDREAYARRVLDHLAPYPPTVGDQPLTGGDFARGVGAVAAAIALAGVTLRTGRRRASARARIRL